MTPTLRSARLLLESYVPPDEDNFVALFGDTRVSRWMGAGPAPEAENRALFWRVFPIYEEQRFYGHRSFTEVGASGRVIAAVSV